MAWKTEMVRILRHLVNDVVEPYAFCDGRLEETILISAAIIGLNLDFQKDYEIDIEELKLTPDPTEGERDNGFVTLVTLKAALVIANGEHRKYASESIIASDGLSKLDFTKRAEHYMKIAEARQKDFEQAKIDYQAGNMTKGFIITGPYSHPDFDINTVGYQRYYSGG